MLHFSLFLHFYQPPTQFPEMTKKISQECYEKILKILQKQKKARLTINFSASLTEQLVNLGLSQIVEGFANLVKEGQIEVTGTAAYHPLLTKIPKSEMGRQIKINEKINEKYFGRSDERGFFPPEMCYGPQVGEVVEKLGFEWIILDESALGRAEVDTKIFCGTKPARKAKPFRSLKNFVPSRAAIYTKKDSNLKFFIRDRKLSLAIAFSQVKSVRELFQFFDAEGYNLNEEGYVIAAMDAETFGHHQPGQLKFLEELLMAYDCQLPTIKLVTVSELLDLFPQRKEIEPQISSWGESWERWDNPQNPIHQLQWKLFSLVLEVGAEVGTNLENFVPPRADASRRFLDRALHSDQFWWASHNPCWHPKMIERGAKMLEKVILSSTDASEREKKQAEKLYNEIVNSSKRLYGEKIII